MFELIDTGTAESDVPVSDAVRAHNLVWSVHISEDPVSGEIVAGDSRDRNSGRHRPAGASVRR